MMITFTIVAIAAAAGLALRTPGWIRTAVSVGLVIALLAKLHATSFPSMPWQNAARLLPFLRRLFAVITFGQLIQRQTDPVTARRMLPCLVMIVLAGLLLDKMALNKRIHHYGFVLTMPARMLPVVALIGLLSPGIVANPRARRSSPRGSARRTIPASAKVSHPSFGNRPAIWLGMRRVCCNRLKGDSGSC